MASSPTRLFWGEFENSVNSGRVKVGSGTKCRREKIESWERELKEAKKSCGDMF